MSLTNPTSTPPFVILVLIYEWREESRWDLLDRGVLNVRSLNYNLGGHGK